MRDSVYLESPVRSTLCILCSTAPPLKLGLKLPRTLTKEMDPNKTWGELNYPLPYLLTLSILKSLYSFEIYVYTGTECVTFYM